MDLRTLYESIDAPGVRRMVEEKREESLTLDFKTITRADFSSRDDRKTLATAVAGFANSAGGLVIWGVDARPNVERIDCASALKPIDNLPLFGSKLNEYLGSATSPLVDGVETRLLEESGNSGYAVTFVPQSQSTPHMAKLGEDRYYKRSGNSFRKMEHFDLEDMFGRRPKAVLELRHELVSSGGARSGGGTETRIGSVVISLENTGRASARAPFLVIAPISSHRVPWGGLDGNRSTGLPQLTGPPRSTELWYGGGLDAAIHPGVSMPVTAIEWGVSIQAGQTVMPQVIEFMVRWASDGAALQEERVRYEPLQQLAAMGLAPGQAM